MMPMVRGTTPMCCRGRPGGGTPGRRGGDKGGRDGAQAGRGRESARPSIGGAGGRGRIAAPGMARSSDADHSSARAACTSTSLMMYLLWNLSDLNTVYSTPLYQCFFDSALSSRYSSSEQPEPLILSTGYSQYLVLSPPCGSNRFARFKLDAAYIAEDRPFLHGAILHSIWRKLSPAMIAP